MKKIFIVIIVAVLTVAAGIGALIAFEWYRDSEYLRIDEEPNSTPTGKFGAYDYVDIGLSVKWATCNVGAKTPGELGQYFAWGDTQTKESFAEDDYTIGERADLVDLKDTQYDTATAIWGNGWRMPTAEEMDELCKKCKWMWAKQNGSFGFKVTGPNGNSIFLPCSHIQMADGEENEFDETFYWSSTKEDDGLSDIKAKEDIVAISMVASFVYFRSDPYKDTDFTHYLQSDIPCYAGLLVRPVHD